MKQYVLLYPITEAEFHFSVDELIEAIKEAGASCFHTRDFQHLFVTSTSLDIVKRIRDEHNIMGVILGCDEFIV